MRSNYNEEERTRLLLLRRFWWTCPNFATQ